MKTINYIYLILIGLLASNQVIAKVITVSNNPNSPGQYSSLQTAIDAALAKDTLYVAGSGLDYGNITITKPLIIIGAGAIPNKNLPLETYISSINYGYTSNNASSGSGSRLTGCAITNITFGTSSTYSNAISNIVLSRNKITNIYWNNGGQTIPYNNYLIENNVITSISGNSIRFNNGIIKNNIINAVSLGVHGAGYWLFSNNVVLASFSSNRSATVTNNIFYVAYAASIADNLYCTFTNNILYAIEGTFDDNAFNTGTNSGTGNIINVDPNFGHYDSFETAIWSYSQSTPESAPYVDFNLLDSSPGKKYGTDGTDVGLHGGSTPFVEGSPADSRYRYFPLPQIPQVLDVTINNTSIPLGGNLEVQLKASKQQ